MSPPALFRRLSLTARLLIVMGLTVALSFPLSMFLLVDSQLALYRSAAGEELAATLATLEPTVAEQVVIGDYALIEQILRTRVRHSHFLEIDFTDGGGNVIAATSAQRPARYPGWFRTWLDLPQRPVVRDIAVGGQRYGQITVWPSHIDFYNHVWHSVLQQGAVILGAGMILFGFVAVVLKRGLDPLRVTTDLALSLRRGEYQCLAVPPGSAAPEIRETIATFNDAASREAWLARFAEIISGGDANDSKVQAVMRLLCARLDMEGAALAWQDDVGEFQVLASCHVDPAANALRWQEFTRAALARGAPVTADRELRQAAGAGVAYMAVPARMGAHRVGAFSLFRRRERAVTHPNGEAELLALAANWMGATLAEEAQEQAIREQKERVETILRNVAEGIATLDADGMIVSANPAMEHIFGCSSRQLIGQPITRFVPGLRWADFCARLPDTEQGGQAASMEGPQAGQRSDGEAITLELSARAVRHADTSLVIAVIRDVTERIRVEAALRRSEARHQRAQEIAHLGSLEYFPATRQTRWSSELRRIFGVESGVELDYQDFLSRVEQADVDRVREALEAGVRESQPVQIEFRVVRSGGERRFVALAAEAPETTAEGARLFAVVQDITERREAEARVQAAVVQQLEAEAHNRAKTLFLANMSHELRTPLNAILGYSEMLEEEAMAEGRQETAADLQKIQAAGRHLLAMINEVLDLSRIEAGRIDLLLEDCAVRPLVDEVLATIEPLAAQNRNVLRVNVDLDGLIMHTDAMRLKQILINLLGNACKFTSDGEISFTTAHEHDDGQAWLRFTVRDTGIGMTASQLDQLFEPFAQAEIAAARKYGGAGLGLAISKHFIDMLGGDITVDSLPQRGSTFSVRLPMVSSLAQDTAGQAEMGARVVEAAGRRMAAQPASNRRARVATVLVAEADPALRELIERYLSGEGFRVVSAARISDAFGLIAKHRPSLLVLDLEEADLDMPAAMERLEQDPLAAQLPVLVLGSDALGQAARKHGAAACLGKPINWQSLATLAKQWVRVAAARARAAGAGRP